MASDKGWEGEVSYPYKHKRKRRAREEGSGNGMGSKWIIADTPGGSRDDTLPQSAQNRKNKKEKDSIDGMHPLKEFRKSLYSQD